MSQPTPETDDLVKRIKYSHTDVVIACRLEAWAQTLERERDEARQQISDSVRAITKAMPNTAFTGELGQAVGVLLAELYRLQPASE